MLLSKTLPFSCSVIITTFCLPADTIMHSALNNYDCVACQLSKVLPETQLYELIQSSRAGLMGKLDEA